MSHEDPYRPYQGRDRGAYTPPTDDDLPFDRGGYDPRRGAQGGTTKAPPLTLMISIAVLLAIVVAVILLKPWETRGSNDAPPAVGTPVASMKSQAPIDAQPIDPEAGIDVYAEAEAPTTAPTFVPPPEAVQPRPLPAPIDAAPLPPAVAAPSTRPAPTTQTASTRPVERAEVQPAPAAPAAPAAGGSSGVQIGAFSTPSLAEREYNAVVGRYSQFTRGASRRVQEVTNASGATLYRTTVAGLSREQATGLCSAIKASGGDCIVR